MRKVTCMTVFMLLLFCLCAVPAACDTEKTEETAESPALKDCPLIYNREKTGIFFQISIDEFSALGFSFGDSVDLSFSNGYTLEDIPYYNGYYVEAYQPLLLAYSSSRYVRATISYGDNLWDTAGLSEGDTGSIFLHEKGKYRADQEAGDIQYTDNREDYGSDEVFANFRNVAAGNIKKNVLYRSASPCDSSHRRAPYADTLEKAAGIQTVLNLADDKDLIDSYIAWRDFNSPYYLSLYQEGQVLPLQISMNFLAGDFQEKLAEGLTWMSQREGPYLVHCTEGKDRTGFVCILLEALCGASYSELEEDYMLTYDNYYGINRQTDPDRYNTIRRKNLDVMLNAIVSDSNVDITAADLSVCAEEYLQRIGVEEETIEIIQEKLQDRSSEAEAA